MNKVVAAVILIGGFLLLWKFVFMLDKTTAFLGNALGQATGKAQKFLSDYRGNTMKRNFGLWQQGSLGNTFGKATRDIGLSVGAAQASTQATGTGAVGAFINPAKSSIARQGVDAQVADEMLKRDGGKYSGFDEANEVLVELGVGATKKQAAQALLARKRLAGDNDFTLKDAEDAYNGMEQSYGGQIGTTQMTLAAAKAGANSNTAYREESWRSTDEAIKSMRDGLNKLVANGSITLTQAAAIMTNNKTRLDLAGAGFAATMGYIKSDGAPEDTRTFKDSFIAGNNAYSLFGQRWETARAGAQHLKSQLDDIHAAMQAPETTDAERAVKDSMIKSLQKRNLLKDRAGNDLTLEQGRTRLLAEIDSGYQAAKNLAPMNAQYLADIVLNHKPGGDNDTPVYQQIVDAKNNNPEMARYAYEFTQASRGPIDPNLLGGQQPPPGAAGPGMPNRPGG